MNKTLSPNQKAIDLRKKLLRLENRSKKLSIEINDVRQEMLLACTHPDVKREHDYIPGGYYDRCVYINKDICKFCGKLINEERTLGGYG